MKTRTTVMLLAIALCCGTAHAQWVQVWRGGSSGGSGDVAGPSSSIDNALCRYDGTTGKLLDTYTSGSPTCSDTGACTFNNVVTLGGGGALALIDGSGSSFFRLRGGSTGTIWGDAGNSRWNMILTDGGNLSIGNGAADAGYTLGVVGTINGTSTITSTGTTLGWTKFFHANQACTTTCVGHGAAAWGWDSGTGAPVQDNDATADVCFCAGP